RELRAEATTGPAAPEIDFARGGAAARLWARFVGGAPVDALLKLSAVDAELALADGPLALAGLDLEAELSRDRDGESLLRFRRREARTDDGLTLRALPDAMQALRFDAGAGLNGGEMTFDRFDAGRLLALARRLPWPDALHERLAPIQAAGSVER